MGHDTGQSSTRTSTPRTTTQRANASTRPETVKQRGYRHRNGITRSTLVSLVEAGRVLETGPRAAADAVAGLLGPDNARAARQAYRRTVDAPGEPVAS